METDKSVRRPRKKSGGNTWTDGVDVPKRGLGSKLTNANYRHRRRSVSHCYSLNLEMPPTKQRGRTNEFASGQILRCEITPIRRIELVVQRQIGAGDLHIDEIVHAHSRLN